MPRLHFEHKQERDRDLFEKHRDDLMVNLVDMRELSPLHSLVVSCAPLDMVRLVYQADTSAMNEAIFYDACRHSKDPAIIEFLKNLVEPSAYSPEKISKIMMEFWKELHWAGDVYQEQIKHLCKMFPAAMVYPEKPGFQTALSLAMECKQDDEVRAQLIEMIPANTKVINFDEWGSSRHGRRSHDLRMAMVSKLKELQSLAHLTLPMGGQDEIDDPLLQVVCGMITSQKLQSLSLVKYYGTARKRFLLPLLDAIGAAPSSSMFCKLEVHMRINDVGLYEERMLDILKTNTKLELVRLGSRIKKYGKQEQIFYITKLNQYGRGLTQDPKVPLPEIVHKLALAINELEDEWITPVLYGLLREAPGKWSESAMEGRDQIKNSGVQPSLKRKASALVDESSN